MAIYVSHGTPGDDATFRDLLRRQSSELWTVPRATRPDDLIAIYNRAPTSGFVALGRVVGPKLVDGALHGWAGFLMTKIRLEHVVEPAVSLYDLRDTFPKWRWLRMPLSQTQVPDEIAPAFLKLLRTPRALIQDEQTLQTERAAGVASAGFGDPETNRKVEAAAIRYARHHLQAGGWEVTDRQRDRCGYDLLARRGRREWHVEVKGVAGPMPGFILTPNERRCAENDPAFRLIVVVNALHSDRELLEYGTKEMLRTFELTPLAYRGRLKRPDRRGSQ